jgi:very-short-patch-repair endonuclease
LAGLKFRRQHPVGPYVLDFYCMEARMAVEVDGQHHSNPDQADKDETRTRWLVKQNIAVLRIPAESVRTNLDGVLTWIRMNAEDRARG